MWGLEADGEAEWLAGNGGTADEIAAERPVRQGGVRILGGVVGDGSVFGGHVGSLARPGAPGVEI